MVNLFASIRPIARLAQATVGMAPERELPRFASSTFQHWVSRHPPRSEGMPVVLWSDTFTNYFSPQVGRAAVNVLEHLRYHVIVPPQTCCGRPLYDFGLLESAREHLDAVLAILTEKPHTQVPIVVLEPSCFAVFQDEARDLSPDRPLAAEIAKRVILFDAFVRPHFARGALPPLGGRALAHVHCHQQAIDGRESAESTLAAARLEAEVLDATHFTAIGAFSRVVVAYFDWTSKEYRHLPIEQQVEVLSLVGDISIEQGKLRIHAHVVVGKEDATAHGGHLVEGCVRPTLEIVLTEAPRHLVRRYDAASGLALIEPQQ